MLYVRTDPRIFVRLEEERKNSFQIENRQRKEKGFIFMGLLCEDVDSDSLKKVVYNEVDSRKLCAYSA